MGQDTSLSSVLDTALDAVVVMRTDGSVAEWNGEAERVFGWNREEALGQMLGELIVPPQHREAHFKGLRHYLATGEGPVLRRRIEITALRRGGEEFPIELSITPTGTPSERLFLAFVRDISAAKAAFAAMERKALEASLLHRVASHAAESVSLDETLKLALDVICELLNWPIGHAFMVPPGGPLLYSHLWVGDLTPFDVLVEATCHARFAPGVGIPGRVWATGQLQWVEELDAETVFVRGTSSVLNIRATFAIPIVSGDRVVAILEFFSPTPQRADPDLILIARTVGEQVGRALERQQAREQQALVLGELEHRTKNMLAVVSSMSAQTARGVQSLEDYRRIFGERLTSLAAAYSLLTRVQWQATPLRDLIREVVEPHLAPQSMQLRLTGEDVTAPAKTALSLSMVLHELSTNAVKYGALSVRDGMITVDISLQHIDDVPTLALDWTETGVEICAPPDKAGFGSRLIERTVRYDLGGVLVAEFPPPGAAYQLRIPLPADADARWSDI